MPVEKKGGKAVLCDSLRNVFHPFLLPVKLMFFFQLGAVACLGPFMPVFIQGLGLNAAEMGMMFGAQPFLALLSKPLTGFITDRFRQTYRLLQISVFVQIVFWFSVYFVPPMAKDGVSVPSNCTLTTTSNSCLPTIYNDSAVMSDLYTVTASTENTLVATAATVIRWTPQFWLVGLLMLVSWFAFDAVWILYDSVTIRLAEQSPVQSSYGENRAFGTMGYAVFALAVGLIMKFLSHAGGSRDFTPAFAAFAVTAAVGFATTFCLPALKQDPTSSSPNGNGVLKTFLTSDVLLFSFGTFVVGVDTGFLHVFLAWYMAELGASQFLLGFTVFVDCCYEGPMMALSSRIIRKLGYHTCMLLCIISFGVRFVGYSLIDNPWLILPINMLHALGFGLFYATMTSFAYAKSTVGNGASLQGILCAIFEGFGQGIGGLVAGFLYHYAGGKRTWMGYGLFSFGAALAYGIGHVVLWTAKKRRRAKKLQIPCGEDKSSPTGSDDLVIKLINDGRL